MLENNTTPQRFYQRRWVTGLASIGVFVALLLVALPYVMSYGLHQWLLQNAGDEVNIEDIDFNVFTGRAAITDLHVKAGGETLLAVPRIDLDVDWIPLYSKHVLVKAVGVDGVELVVVVDADGNMRIGGVALPESGESEVEESAWGFGLEQLQITNTTVNYHQPDLQLDVRMDDVALSRLHTWISKPAPFSFKGSINGAATTLDGELPPLSSGVGYKGRISINALNLADFAGLLADAVSGPEGRLSMDTGVDVLVESGPGANRTRISFDGSISGEQLAVTLPDEGLSIDQEAFTWTGNVTVESDETTRVKAEGRIKLTGLGADASSGEETIRLVQLDGLELGNLKLDDAGDIVFTDLVVTGAVFAHEAAGHKKQQAGGSVLSAGSIHVDTIKVSAGNQVSIGTLQWNDVTSIVVRDSDGQWRPVRILDTLPFTGDAEEQKFAEEKPAGEVAEPGNVKVEQILVSGNSLMLFEDDSIEPPLRLRLNVARASLKNIDTTKPRQTSPISIRSNFGKHSRLDVDGWIMPFAEQPTLELKLAAEGVALLPLSPYMIQTFGYVVESGQLDATSSVSISKGQLESGNQLTLRALEVVPAENESREQLESALAIPLDTALNMLRDSNDTISLDLPVSGNLDDPEFDASSVINIALGKAVKAGSLTFLSIALQPYGALISVARIAGEAATRVRLQPVGFETGSAEQMIDGEDYLEKVAGVLNKRPEVNIKVCGLSVEEDRAVKKTDEQLLTLAQQRADFVKDHLVSNHGVTAARLVACQPHIEDADQDGAPRVDLLI